MAIRIITKYATKSGAYKVFRKMPGGKPCGLLWHSTGADNPWVRRYAGEADTPAPIGSNPYGNGFMVPGGNDVCPNAVMGLGTDGKMLTVKILPDDICSWCSGQGDTATAKKNGFSGNNANFLSFYQVEVCEDKTCVGTVYGMKNPYSAKEYAKLCYDEMVAFSIDFFKTNFGGAPAKVTPKTLTSHAEGNEMGIASNHADPWHWLGKYGYNGDTLRADVKKGLQLTVPVAPAATNAPGTTYTVVKGDTMSGIAKKFGATLGALKSANPQVKDIDKIYPGQKVNIPVSGTSAPALKSIDEVAKEVINGKWGNGEDRKKRLTAAGYDYGVVQKRVNEMLG